MSAIVGAGFPRPMGWGTQPFLASSLPYPANPSIPGEASGFRQPPHCTPLECCSWTNRPAIDITLRWSEKQSRFPVLPSVPPLLAPSSCPSSGALVMFCTCRPSIDITLRWSEKQSRLPRFPPLGLWCVLLSRPSINMSPLWG